jgi:hypothetical protein
MHVSTVFPSVSVERMSSTCKTQSTNQVLAKHQVKMSETVPIPEPPGRKYLFLYLTRCRNLVICECLGDDFRMERALKLGRMGS